MLKKFRNEIINDIEAYYQDAKTARNLTAEVQIEIVRFVLTKLRDWKVEIYAHLKFLEVIFGEDDISFKYEEASYMYTQLVVAF